MAVVEERGHPGVGFIPTITEASMGNSDVLATAYTDGDQVTFTMSAKDEGSMTTLLVTEFPAGSETPVEGGGPFEITLPAQGQGNDTPSYSDLGPITLSGTPGEYRMDLQAVDASGTKSDVYSIDYTLE